MNYDKPRRKVVCKRRINASPLAKKRARAAGIDLKTITGSGPRGRIVKADVKP